MLRIFSHFCSHCHMLTRSRSWCSYKEVSLITGDRACCSRFRLRGESVSMSRWPIRSA